MWIWNPLTVFTSACEAVQVAPQTRWWSWTWVNAPNEHAAPLWSPVFNERASFTGRRERSVVAAFPRTLKTSPAQWVAHTRSHHAQRSRRVRGTRWFLHGLHWQCGPAPELGSYWWTISPTFGETEPFSFLKFFFKWIFSNNTVTWTGRR